MREALNEDESLEGGRECDGTMKQGHPGRTRDRLACIRIIPTRLSRRGVSSVSSVVRNTIVPWLQGFSPPLACAVAQVLEWLSLPTRWCVDEGPEPDDHSNRPAGGE